LQPCLLAVGWCTMGAESICMVIVLFLSTLLGYGNSGNINTDSCSVRGDCLGCFATQTPEVERCLQQRILFMGSVSVCMCKLSVFPTISAPSHPP
jgi:hypothetical protein